MIRRSKKEWWLIIKKWIIKLTIFFFVGSIISTILFRWIPIPVTPLMLIRCGQQVINGEKLKLYKDWVPLEEISPNLQLAIVICEDQEFLNHYGFDVEGIKKAIKSNSKGKRLRGGSSISQQTAKNLFLWNGRNFIRKGLEVYFTLLIETFWSKERILEVYLNIAEMGDGIYGAQEASRYYFRKNASELKRGEAASLAVIMPNPRKYKVNHLGPYLQKRKEWTINQMKYWGYKLDFEENNTPGNEEDQ